VRLVVPKSCQPQNKKTSVSGFIRVTSLAKICDLNLLAAKTSANSVKLIGFARIQ